MRNITTCMLERKIYKNLSRAITKMDTQQNTWNEFSGCGIIIASKETTKERAATGSKVEKMKKEVFERLSIEEQNRLACTDNENAPVIMFQIPARYFPKVRARMKGGYSDKQVLDLYHMLRKFCQGEAAEALKASNKKMLISVDYPKESWKEVFVLFSTLETELEGMQPMMFC